MSGAFQGVPNTFQNAVTATGLQLDQDFNTITYYLNDPTNRYNYAADNAATNTVVLTFAPPVIGGYTAGLALSWKWGASNTGGVQLNANGLGNVSVVNPDGSALQAGQGLIGSIGKAIYDGTRAIYLTPPSPATKAQMQTATASATFLTPAIAQHHPGVAKAWAYFTGTSTGTITAIASYNVGSIVRTGTGTYSISFALAMASTAYVIISQGSAVGWSFGSKTTAGFVIFSDNTNTQAAADAGDANFVAFGNQ